MFKRLSQRKIKNNWSTYKQHIKKALESTEGCQTIMGSDNSNIYKGIYGRLLNPFKTTMHLWVDDKEEFIYLTHLQTCEFTGNKTLVLFTATRIKEVDKETLDKRYYDYVKTVSQFAKENGCVGMYSYSDLDYFAKMAKRTQDWTNVITRYQFYFPLN